LSANHKKLKSQQLNRLYFGFDFIDITFRVILIKTIKLLPLQQ